MDTELLTLDERRVLDLSLGVVAMYFAGVPVALSFVKAGRVRPLGVTGAKRAAVLPDVPTAAESGLKGFEVVLNYGLLAPAGTMSPAMVASVVVTGISFLIMASV